MGELAKSIIHRVKTAKTAENRPILFLNLSAPSAALATNPLVRAL